MTIIIIITSGKSELSTIFSDYFKIFVDFFFFPCGTMIITADLQLSAIFYVVH